MKKPVSTAMLAVGLLASQGANAKVFAECGAFKGYAYYYPGPLMKKKDTGFGEDGISKGSFSIVTIEDKFDVIFTDASGFTQSSLSQGAKIIPVGTVPKQGRLVLLVNYPNETVEIYSYHGASKTLTLLQHKYKGPISSAKLFVSNCK